MGLGEVARPAPKSDGAFLMLFESGQDPQQGGFAGAVFAHHGHMLAGSYDKVDAVQQQAVAIAVGNAGEVQVFGQGKSSQSSAGWPPEPNQVSSGARRTALDFWGTAGAGCCQDFIVPACPSAVVESSAHPGRF
jgi:hypothetical protein